MKLKSIQFKNHKILGDLYVDFCDSTGEPVDTILIAGENGTGKSTLLDEIYNIVIYNVYSPMTIMYSNDNKEFKIDYFIGELNGKDAMISRINDINKNYLQFAPEFKNIVIFCGIFSDVDINFHSESVSTVSSLDIDVKKESRKSDQGIAKEIQQLIIDIQNLDDAQLSKKVREHNGHTITINDELTNGRMDRFLKAFNFMFCDLIYDGIENISGNKKIIFKRGDKKIYLENLSSGEKQIIYRGSFLLQDINALKGAVVLIDEPEISIHPDWQKKIMDFYKRIFTNNEGMQTSQIFAVTHSPFIIHNELRKNDKVIVLTRNKNGEITVLDKPEYYISDSKQVVKDAFQQDWFSPNENTVYLEGRTDEKYFEKVLEVFGHKALSFKFKWIGHMNSNGQEEFTGKDSLSKAFQFSLSAKYKFKQVFLFDCDTQKKEVENGLSYTRVIPQYKSERFKVGIENALVIDEIDSNILNKFYSHNDKINEYGAISNISDFEKMKFCEYICSLDNKVLKKIFANLENEIIKLVDIFE